MNALTRTQSIQAWLGGLALVVLGVLLFPSAGRDDVHISFWMVDALVDHGAFVNYSGETLEVGSSLLHLLLLALLVKVTGLSVVMLGTPLSVLFGALAVVEAGRLAARLVPTGERAPVAWTVAVAATATPLVYWSFGALETTLVAFLVTALIRSTVEYLAAEPRRSVAGPLLWGSLYLIARPEAFFVATAFAAAVGIALAWLRTDGRARPLWLLWAAWLALFVALCTWRHFAFGEIFPHAVYAKVDARSTTKLWAGAKYFYYSFLHCPQLGALALLAAWAALRTGLARRREELPAWIVAAFLAAQVSFVFTSGGDWMEGARFLVPIVPAVAALGVWWLGRALPQRLALVAGVLVAGGLVQLVAFTLQRSTGVPLPYYAQYRDWAAQQGVDLQRFSFYEIANRVHLRDALFIPRMEAVVDEMLQTQPSVRVVSSQGGMVPFHLFQTRFGRLKFMDLGGLTSSEIGGCRVLERNPNKRSSGGLGITDAFYIANLDAFRDECGVPLPDLYYNIDIDGQLERLLEESGRFRIVVRQRTDVCPAGTPCPPSIGGNITLAVRTR